MAVYSRCATRLRERSLKLIDPRLSMLERPWRTLGTNRALGTRSSRLTSCARTAIGLKVKDGIVLAVEKLVHSKLLVPHANRRIQTIDRHIGLVRGEHPLTLSTTESSHRRLPLDSLRMGGISATGPEMKPPIIVKRTTPLPPSKSVPSIKITACTHGTTISRLLQIALVSTFRRTRCTPLCVLLASAQSWVLWTTPGLHYS